MSGKSLPEPKQVIPHVVAPSPLLKSTPSTPNVSFIKKRSVIVEDAIKEPIQSQPHLESKTVECDILPNEECTLQVIPSSGNVITSVPLYSIVCPDDLFGLVHYLKPIDGKSPSFDICVKNLTSQERKMSITYYILG